MVAKGNYSLRLINASSMKPLQEHCSSTGKPYVTLASNVDFFVQLEQLTTTASTQEEDNPIFYQIVVGSASSSARHNFKRRRNQQRLLSGGDEANDPTSIYRFDRTTTATTTPASATELDSTTASAATCSSVVMEKVAVHVFEGGVDGKKKKHLETITLHCCVVPPINIFLKPTTYSGLRTTSLGSLLRAAKATTTTTTTGSPCFLKKTITTTNTNSMTFPLITGTTTATAAVAAVATSPQARQSRLIRPTKKLHPVPAPPPLVI